MPPPNLKPHSIRVAHQQAFNQSGQPEVQTNLTYHVGDHGPFHHTYPANEGTADKMKSDITAQVSALESLHQLEL